MAKNKELYDTDDSLDVDGMRRGVRALVLKPVLKSMHSDLRDPDAVLDEAIALAEAIRLDVVQAALCPLSRPTPSMLFGRGKVEEWEHLIEDEEIKLVVVDHELSPIQQRNLEKAWSCKVIDRTGLILEIFGERARTNEGKLQVELAALSYQKSRLVRSWTHLERQRGGFGFMGGPGESQLEIDRRLITDRIIRLKADLAKVRQTRALGRTARQKSDKPTVALVGYTNAGKSTLFNKLTGADVMAKDMLFATLDPSLRSLLLPSGREVIFSDTVGFISDLPTHLVEAFRATLEEVQCADLILHVRDVVHPDARAQKEAVEIILDDLGIEPDDPRLVEVLNKADLLPEDEREKLDLYARKRSEDAAIAPDLEGLQREALAGTVLVSALSGEGLDQLCLLLEKSLAERARVYHINCDISDGEILSWLYAHGRVLAQEDGELRTRLSVDLDEPDFGRFISKFKGRVDVES